MMNAPTGQEIVRGFPDGGALLEALAGFPPAYLVGGAVRDALRGAVPVDVDIAVEGEIGSLAWALSDHFGAELLEHERFGTARLAIGGVRVDLARTRRERYAAPGGLPEVAPASIEDDLARRDFTVNAVALPLGGEAGEPIDPFDGRADLVSKTIRVLHPRSFLDDPTRLLRAVRYEVRLDSRMEPQTERLARAAIDGGALGTVSGARLGAELLLLLGELDFVAALERMVDLGFHERWPGGIDPALCGSAALAALDTGADRVLSALAALLLGLGSGAPSVLEQLELDAGAAQRVRAALREAPPLAAELRGDAKPSEIFASLDGVSPEGIALALALGAAPEPLLSYLASLQCVTLEISGEDLRAAGIAPSPVIGAALRATLLAKLDGLLDGREAELAAALEFARGGAS